MRGCDTVIGGLQDSEALKRRAAKRADRKAPSRPATEGLFRSSRNYQVVCPQRTAIVNATVRLGFTPLEFPRIKGFPG